MGSGITLTNNEVKDIKVIKSLENRGILLLQKKVTTRKKKLVKKEDFSIFLGH